MARPTKEQKEKREKIINLEIFKRDSLIYTRFENRIEDFSTEITSYMFCSECAKRTNLNSDPKEFKKEEIIIKKNKTLETQLKKLYDIDKFISFYILYIHLSDSLKVLDKKDFKFYSVQNINIELDEWERYSNPSTIRLIHKNYTPYNPFRLNDTKENANDYDLLQRVNRVYAELDLSKPISELLEFVTMIKDEYELDHTNIYNDDFKPHQCDLPNCDIYKSKNPKPIHGRLSDVLFIYDCKKAGLHNDYIIDEINRYWQDVKNLFRDKFRASTLTDYYNFSKKYIDKKEYQSFVCGYDLFNK